MFNELVEKLSFDDLEYFKKVELPKIDLFKVSRFLINPDIKDFLIEYLWEVGASDHFIKKIEKASVSDRHIYLSYVMIDYDGIYYIVLPSGAVVSWI